MNQGAKNEKMKNKTTRENRTLNTSRKKIK